MSGALGYRAEHDTFKVNGISTCTHPVVPEVGMMYAALLLFARPWTGFNEGWRDSTKSLSIEMIVAIVPSNEVE